MENTSPDDPYAQPRHTPPPMPERSPGRDGTGGVIPYNNGPALASYYCGIASMLPILGLIIGIPAFVLGLKGLKRYKKFPEVKGRVHAWIGIILGAGSFLLQLAVAALIAVAAISDM